MKQPYKTVRLSATFDMRFIVLSYITHQYEQLEEQIMPLAPLFTKNLGMHNLNGILHRMCKVQLSQRGSRAQTVTLKGQIEETIV